MSRFVKELGVPALFANWMRPFFGAQLSGVSGPPYRSQVFELLPAFFLSGMSVHSGFSICPTL